MISRIEINEAKFFAHHGVFNQERTVGNDFTVSLWVETDISDSALEADDINATINYASLYDIIAREMEIPSRLLENVAYRIVQAVTHSFPQVARGQVAISKLTPPFKCDLKDVTVSLSF